MTLYWKRVTGHLLATSRDGTRWTIKLSRPGVRCYKLMQNGSNGHLPSEGFFSTLREAKQVANKLAR